VWETNGMGGIHIFIPAMLGQVGKCLIEIQLLQMCYPDPFECSSVSNENMRGVCTINGMGGINTFIPAMLGQVWNCSLGIKLLQMCYPEPCECSCVPKENFFEVLAITGMGDTHFYPSNAGACGERQPRDKTVTNVLP